MHEKAKLITGQYIDERRCSHFKLSRIDSYRIDLIIRVIYLLQFLRCYSSDKMYCAL